MQREAWDNFLDYLQKKQTDMFVNKRGQYATEEDVLKNFKQTALMNRETPERSLWGFVSKHINSVFGMIQNDLTENKKFTYEEYEDKAIDIYNYMALLLAIIKEREEKKNLEEFIDQNRTARATDITSPRIRLYTRRPENHIDDRLEGYCDDTPTCKD